MNEQNPPRIGVGVLIENEKGEVLLGQRKGSHGAGEWQLPGGKLHFNETIFACARRETREETGLIVSDCELISVYDEFEYIETSGYHWVNIGVKVKYEGGEPQCMEPEKCTGWTWHSFDDLPVPFYAGSKGIIDNYRNSRIYEEGRSTG